VPVFEHILVATDFGSSSLRAVRVAAELAAQLTARLTLLHVIQAPAAVHPEDAPSEERGACEDAECNARRELDAFVESLAERAILCDGAIRFGDPAHEIVAYLEESGCELVVVGTHGRAGLSRWLLGSVAERIVRTAPVPVLTVRAASADEPALAAP
jgi:nucleotide-binding universal stress UspA family protein